MKLIPDWLQHSDNVVFDSLLLLQLVTSTSLDLQYLELSHNTNKS